MKNKKKVSGIFILMASLIVFNGLGQINKDYISLINVNSQREKLILSNPVKSRTNQVTNITNFTLIGRYVEGTNRISEVATYDDYLIVADVYDSLKVLEVSNSTNPRKVFHDWPGGKWNGIEVVENRLYVAHQGDGLQIYDISDPTNLLKYGILWLNEEPPYTNPQDVAVQGSYAYLADDYRGLQVVDVSDISWPASVGRWNDGGSAKGVAVSEAYAYVIETSGELEIIDISDPLNPTEISNVTDGGNGRNIVVKENIVYVADLLDGLEIYNVSDPFNPTLITKYKEGTGEANGLSVNNTLLYLADGNDGLEVLDISDLSSPVRMFKSNSTQYATNVHINASRVYLCQEEGTVDILEINSNKQAYLPSLEIINKRLKLEPIVITSNHDFENYWFSGDGTQENPFIIEQLHIQNNRTSIISISNTDVWFILRNSIFDGININFGGMGIFLENVKNGYIVNNTIRGCSQGITIVYSENIIVAGNTLVNNGGQGIYLFGSMNCLIADNSLLAQSYEYSSSSNDYGMEIYDSQNNSVLYNEIQKFRLYGVTVDSTSNNNRILYNNFIENNGGLMFQAYDSSSNNNFSYNYWDNFISPDNNEDGIVDVPYLIDGGNSSDLFPQTFPLNHTLTSPNLYLDPSDSGIFSIHWSHSVDSYDTAVTYSVYYSKEEIFWTPVTMKTSELVIDLNTETLTDGTYFLRVIAQSTTGLISYGALDETIVISKHFNRPTSTSESISESTNTSTTHQTTSYPILIIMWAGFIFILRKKRRVRASMK